MSHNIFVSLMCHDKKSSLEWTWKKNPLNRINGFYRDRCRDVTKLLFFVSEVLCYRPQDVWANHEQLHDLPEAQVRRGCLGQHQVLNFSPSPLMVEVNKLDHLPLARFLRAIPSASKAGERTARKVLHLQKLWHYTQILD
jgi:hypothetical protein